MAAYYNEIDPYVAQWLRNLIGAGFIRAFLDAEAHGFADVRDSGLIDFADILW